MFLFQKIEETMMRYTDARHAVGEFIIREQDELYKYTIGEIAERTYTSKATVVRFAQSMGYEGWKEFMKDYVEEVWHEKKHSSDIDWNFPFDENDTMDTIIQNIKKVQIESINETADLLDKEMVDTAVNYIDEARNIVIFANSPNLYLGELFKRKLFTIGKMATVAATGETGIIAATMDKNDCAIMISYSGNNPTKNPMDKIKILKKNKVRIIGITSGGNNYMREKIDCVFTIASRERLYTKIANYSTEESIQYILNVIFSCLFAKHYRENKNYKIFNSRMLERERNTSIKQLQDKE